jgi:heptosyltransferase-2
MVEMARGTRKAERVLVVRTYSIGDVLLLTPSLRALRRRFPNAHLAMLVGRWSAPVVEDNPYLDEVITFDDAVLMNRRPLGTWRLVRELRLRRFEWAFVFQRSSRYHLFTALAGIPRRVGFDWEGSGWPLTHRVPWRQTSDRYAGDVQLDLVRRVGGDEDDLSLDMVVGEKERRWVSTFLRQRTIGDGERLVALFPGGGANPRDTVSVKRWGVKKFQSVGTHLATLHRATVVVVGSADERELARQVVGGIRGRVYDLSGTMDLKQLAALLERCYLLVTNDSAPLHIAAAVECPTVSIWGPTSAAILAPRGERHVAVVSSAPCSPCYGNSPFPGCPDPHCMEAVPLEDVIRAVDDQMDRSG